MCFLSTRDVTNFPPSAVYCCRQLYRTKSDRKPKKVVATSVATVVATAANTLAAAASTVFVGLLDHCCQDQGDRR